MNALIENICLTYNVALPVPVNQLSCIHNQACVQFI